MRTYIILRGKTNRLIRKRTKPQIVNSTFLYWLRFRQNLSLATRNILTRPITCSTPMRDEDNFIFLFLCFCYFTILLFLLRSDDSCFVLSPKTL